MSESIFKIGDNVIRTGCSHPEHGIVNGGVYTIKDLLAGEDNELAVICLEEDPERYYDSNCFELYVPQPTELEEALAKIDTLESALEDAVRELIGLHTRDNTAVIDVNHNGFKPIREMTLEDWEAAQSLGWVFETNVGSEDTVERIDYNDSSYPVCFFELGWKTLDGFENYHEDSRTEFDVNITRRTE